LYELEILSNNSEKFYFFKQYLGITVVVLYNRCSISILQQLHMTTAIISLSLWQNVSLL